MFHCYWSEDEQFSETESDFRSSPFSFLEDDFDTNLMEPSYTEGEE